MSFVGLATFKSKVSIYLLLSLSPKEDIRPYIRLKFSKLTLLKINGQGFPYHLAVLFAPTLLFPGQYIDLGKTEMKKGGGVLPLMDTTARTHFFMPNRQESRDR